MLTPESDLTAAARIRNAALECYAQRGAQACTIRQIASAAGVSPGLVQHHYKSKEALRRAVNKYVAWVGVQALQVGSAGNESTGKLDGDIVQAIGDRMTGWMRDHHYALLYLTRSISEGDEEAMKIFDDLVDAGDSLLQQLKEGGLLRAGLDDRWAVLHVLVMNFATALLEPAINRHLPSPLLEHTELERWNRASTEMFRSGFFHSSE